MYNKALIATLVILFVGVITFPFWYGKIVAGAGSAPKLELPPGGQKQCVEATEYMRKNHVDLLIRWRDWVVRDGDLKYSASDGKEYTMSLTTTCMGCHSNKANFCDRCHDYVPVKPRCWTCHTFPEKGGSTK